MPKKREQQAQPYDVVNPTTELTRTTSASKNKANWQPVLENGVSRAVILFLIAAAILGIIIGRVAARFDEKAVGATQTSPLTIIESAYRSL